MSFDVLMLILFGMLFMISLFFHKPKRDAYTKLAELRQDERVLHDEKSVRWKLKTGPLGFGWGTADVVITNERILVFNGSAPSSIVDFTRQESLPYSWLTFHRLHLMNVTRDDIRVTTDESGNPCLELEHEDPKRIRIRYYLRDLQAARVLFTEEAESETEPAE